MCEYCNMPDINHAEAWSLIAEYRKREGDSVVSFDELHANFSAVYNNEKMASFAIRRLEDKNRILARIRQGFLAKDVISELETLVCCNGCGNNNLDG